MEKLMGFVLFVAAAYAAFYIITHMDQLTKFSIPVPQQIIDYLKIEPFKK